MIDESSMLQIFSGYKQFGPKIIFDDVTFSINEDEHVGVIGPNGAGKTTLFKILVDIDQLDSGEVIKSQGLRIGYLEQESDWSLDQSSEQYLQENCTKPLWDLKQTGKSLGLTEEHFQKPLKNLSGGYRMRMKLLYLIGVEPDLMLLDEPTNFLDLESILALENFLQNYKGAFLLISHDREFLRRTTDATLEVEAGEITKFPGNIDDYFEQKSQLQEVLKAQAANQALKRKQIQDFVDRFRSKASKAKQAQSRLKQLEKMEVIEIKDLPVKAQIKIPSPIHTGKETLLVENANMGYSDKCILKNVTLRLEKGARLGIVGFNGVGKSTLLKSLAGRIPLLSGTLKFGYQVSLSYFAQHVTEDLLLEDTVLQSLQKAAHPEILGQEILNMAGSLLFSGDDVYKKVNVLSGGEKTRVALGQMLLKKSPLLIMDEPTNHLDFDTVEALTNALSKYEGTLLVVSHDRSFIRRVSNKILEINNGRVEMYPGTYDDYVWSLERGVLSERTSDFENNTKNSGGDKKNLDHEEKGKPNYKEHTKSLQNEVRHWQKKIKQLEAQILKLTIEQNTATEKLNSVSGIEAQELAKNLNLISQQISMAEDELLSAMESLENKEQELKNWVR
jgi:ATP-binding cassette subfamily F protein 3